MDRLVDFINHGILPFAGRAENLNELVSFWRNTIEAQELRSVLLSGEAGVGKSRLLDEVVAVIEDAGGTAIRVRLVPESGTSIIPLLSQALWYDERIRRLLKSEPDASPGAVAAWIRRIARLRPTIIIIEDIHLLGAESVPDLALLLESVAEETLLVLYSARPVELAARGLLERFFTREISLHGLETVAVRMLWHELFGHPPMAGLGEAIADATGGNPLAIRAALTSAIKSGTLRHNPLNDYWQPGSTLQELELALRRSIDLLAEGMAAGLNEEERRAAESLAALGEVFAPETARELIADAERLTNRLAFKGILVTSPTTIPALPGRASAHPLLAFTHSLLHQHFAAASPAFPPHAIAAIAGGAPLYSILPLEQIGRNAIPDGLAPDALSGLLERCLAIARHLDLGPTWRDALNVWSACHAFVERSAPCWRKEELQMAEARLAISKLSLMRRFAETPEYGELVEQALARTSDARTAPMREQRLSALRWHYATLDHENAEVVLRQIEEFTNTYPELRRTRTYLIILRTAAEIAARIPDVPMLRRVESSLEDFLNQEELPAELRALALQVVAPQFLILFDSQEEFTRRLHLLDQILQEADRSDTQLFIRRLVFLESTGQMKAALRASEEGIEACRRHGLAHMAFQCSLTRLCALAALGRDLRSIEEEAWQLCETMERGNAAAKKNYCALYLAEVGLLRGDPAWTRAMLKRFGSDESERWLTEIILLSLDRGMLHEALATIGDDDIATPLEARLCRFARAIDAAIPGNADEVCRDLGAILETPLLRTSDLMIHTAALALADAATGGTTALRESMAGGIMQALEWLSERELGGYLNAFLERFGAHLTRRNLIFWRARAAELRQESIPSRATERSRYQLAMIGAIAVTKPDGEVHSLRGARLKTMLGLLVAARMVNKPLSNNEFCSLASGGELDIDLARKTTNMAVVRLRESLGDEFIRTGAETHELNSDLVDVDLLEADRHLRHAMAALRRRALMLAYPAMMRVLHITRGEVVFPGLYDDFFEAIREDFENRQRLGVIDIARALMLEHDHESAVRLLKLAFEWMPDDEEISELLRGALEQSGSRADAHRVGLQGDMELET